MSVNTKQLLFTDVRKLNVGRMLMVNAFDVLSSADVTYFCSTYILLLLPFQDLLLGDSTKAKSLLNWEPTYDLMVSHYSI